MADSPVILITGTSRGIGNHLARHFLSTGARVIGCSRSDQSSIDHENYSHFALDIGSEPEVVEMFRSIRSEFGRLDAAVNNAAVNPTLSLVAMTSYAAAEQTMRTNFLGPFVVAREAVKLMMRNKFGRIVNLGSMAARHEVQGEALYTASKAALNSFTRVLAKEVAAHGITVNVVAPAALETELMSSVDPVKLKEVLQRNAIPALGTFEEVSNIVDWLLKPESGAVTGQIIYLGGA